MSLRVAVQMDPLESINISGDSTFAIMLKAQELGHELYHYAPDALSYSEGRLWTMGFPVKLRWVGVPHRPRRAQSRVADGALQSNLSRAARSSEIPAGDCRGR